MVTRERARGHVDAAYHRGRFEPMLPSAAFDGSGGPVGTVRPARRARGALFGFQLGRRQWVGIILVAVSLALLGVTGKQSGGDSSDYS